MTALDIAQLELNAAKIERLKISAGLNQLAAIGRAQAAAQGKSTSPVDVLVDIANMTERGEFSK